jgi:hypothetical protein
MENILNSILLQLSAYPHVLSKLDLLWGTKDCRDYLTNLVMNDRDGRQPINAKGFPLEIINLIICILEIHDELYPHFAVICNNVW